MLNDKKYAGRPVAHVTRYKGLNGWLWLLDSCPYCQCHHRLGAGRDALPQYLGHRAAPCAASSYWGFVLVEVTE